MKIIVLAGGTSTERDVSLSTGKQVCTALKKNGHDAFLLDVFLGIETEQPLETLFTSGQDLDRMVHSVTDAAPDLNAILALPRKGSDGFFGPNVLTLCRMADIVYMALHGENGENGKIQAVFDLMDIRYTGSGYFGSAVSMNKRTSKDILTSHQIPVPKGISVRRCDMPLSFADTGLSFPCIVKPCCGGSSVGMSKATDEAEFAAALSLGFSYEDELLIEECIIGREFSVGLIDGKSLPVIEIAPKEGLYDYKNKYQSGLTVETCPADLDAGLTAQLQALAEQAYAALHLQAYGRIDFLMDADHRIYCLEANTLPGMTPTSLLPQEAAQIGMNFETLCERIIEVSLQKYNFPCSPTTMK